MWKRAAHLSFWLGASLYFGGLVALGAVAAPAIFDTAKSANLAMPGIASPPLFMDTQVGGEIFGNILNRFAWIEVISLGLLLLGLAVPLVAHRPIRRSAWILFILWIALAGFLAYDAAVLRPQIWALRDQVRATASQHVTTGPWPEHDQFEQLHDRAELLARAKVYILLGMILLGSWRGLTEKPLPQTKPASVEV